jgi:hypothetical protein
MMRMTEDDLEAVLKEVCTGHHDWEELVKPGYKCLKKRSCYHCKEPFRCANDGIEGKDGLWPSGKNPGYCCRRLKCRMAVCWKDKEKEDLKSPMKKRRGK